MNSIGRKLALVKLAGPLSSRLRALAGLGIDDELTRLSKSVVSGEVTDNLTEKKPSAADKRKKKGSKIQ